MTWILWVILVLIAVAVWFGCRYETIHDNRRRGYVVYNKLFGHPAYDGRIFWSLRSAQRAQRKLVKKVAWCEFTVMRVV